MKKQRKELNKALSLEADGNQTDYLLNPSYYPVWITIGNISVYLRKNDEGVVDC